MSANTPPSQDLISALADEEGRLSGLERRLAGIVLDDMAFATNASITDLAARAEVSPPTVTRFCRRLGCSSFSDFKVQLARSPYVGLRYLRPDTAATGAIDVAEDVVTKAQNALHHMFRTMDMPQVEAAARLLRGAGMIHAFGSGGNSSMIVNEIQNRLFRLGCRVAASNDHGMNLMLAAAADPQTVVIGSSFTGRNAELVRCFRLLADRGVPTIALTQSGSPVAEAADIVLAVDLPEGQNIFRPTASRYAWLALVDVLASLVAQADPARAGRTLRDIKEQLVRHRDGDDRQPLGD